MERSEALTKADAQLIYSIEGMLLQGMTRDMVEFTLYGEAIKAGVEPPSPQAITDAYAAIAERWVNDASSDPKEINGFHIRAWKHLYAKSYKLNDFKTCLQILADLAKIQHQYAAATAKRK